MNRRSFLNSVAVALGTSTLEKVARADASEAPQSPAASANRPRLRVAQLADTHVTTDFDCPVRVRKCLAALHGVGSAPDLIVHTGDVIYDALDRDRDAVTRQWALWKDLARDLPSAPIYAIGNHDVWGRGPASDSLYGKNWAVDVLGLSNRFYSVAKGGWRFVVLDSVHAIPRSTSSLPGASNGWYTARLDEEQLSWLKGELRNTPAETPVAIVSHIPILSAAIFDWANTEGDAWTIRNRFIHSDSHAIQGVLRQHKNVKLCLSGHLHLLDHVVYDGITYLGCGAVCGNNWKEPYHHQTHCGFATLDLFPDGSFQRTYHSYDW
jgi:Icc protein